jgi:hypothetical protein
VPPPSPRHAGHHHGRAVTVMGSRKRAADANGKTVDDTLQNSRPREPARRSCLGRPPSVEEVGGRPRRSDSSGAMRVAASATRSRPRGTTAEPPLMPRCRIGGLGIADAAWPHQWPRHG